MASGLDEDRGDGGAADVVDWLAAAQGGNTAAFNQLVLLHQRRVFSLCYRVLGNAEDAADVAQEAFLSAFRAIQTFRGPPEALAGWLMRVASNGCYDHLRRAKRRPTESLDAAIETDEGAVRAAAIPRDPGEGPELRALASETARHIQAGLNTLTADQRLAVVLCDVQGLSYEEAAETMRVELGTVKSRLNRARVALRSYLASRGELPGSGRRLH